MRKRHQRSDSQLEGLRLAVECLPVATRQAMLVGVRANPRILVGSYVDEHGGVCPMLAAHRCGGRTELLTFAKSWDRFAGARKGRRVASEREVRILVTLLETSLASSSGLELDRAIADHRRLLAEGRRRRPRRLPAAADPRGEIRARRLRLPRYRPSPGRRNMISGTTHAGDVRSR